MESVIDKKIREISPLFDFFQDLKKSCEEVLQKKPDTSTPPDMKTDRIIPFRYRRCFNGKYRGETIECKYYHSIEPFKYKILDSRVYIETASGEKLYIRMGDYGNDIFLKNVVLPLSSSSVFSILNLYESQLKKHLK